MNTGPKIHTGSSDVKYASLFNESLKDFKIEQFGVEYAREGFSLG